MKIRFRILLLALTWASVVSGQDLCKPGDPCYRAGIRNPSIPVRPAQSAPNPAVVRVIAEDDRGHSYGTGTLIKTNDPRGIVVTCAHMFDASTISVTVVFPNGHQAVAEILYCDSVREIAVLAITKPSIEPIVLAAEPAWKGDIVTAGGFGKPNERYRTFGGPAFGYISTEINPGESLLIPGWGREGDSGGPMLNAQGELVAVIWGREEDILASRGTYTGRIKKILSELFKPRDDVLAMTPMQRSPVAETPPVEQPSPVPPPSTVAEASIATIGQADSTEPVAAASGAVESPPPSRSSLLERALPVALTALGWTGPPSLVALLAARFGWAAWRRRKARKPTVAKADGAVADAADVFQPASIPRDDTEAKQFLQLSQLEGRSPLHDALIGRFAFDEIQNTIDREPDGLEAGWARKLRRTLKDRFNEMAPVAVFNTLT